MPIGEVWEIAHAGTRNVVQYPPKPTLRDAVTRPLGPLGVMFKRIDKRSAKNNAERAVEFRMRAAEEIKRDKRAQAVLRSFAQNASLVGDNVAATELTQFIGVPVHEAYKFKPTSKISALAIDIADWSANDYISRNYPLVGHDFNPERAKAKVAGLTTLLGIADQRANYPVHDSFRNEGYPTIYLDTGMDMDYIERYKGYHSWPKFGPRGVAYPRIQVSLFRGSYHPDPAPVSRSSDRLV